MKIIELKQLKAQIPEQFSPSGANWILKCPLRGLFKNADNNTYDLPNNYAASVGNVIHKVLDASNHNMVSHENEFNLLWNRAENEELDGGLKFLVRNYARYKYAAKKLAFRQNRGHSSAKKQTTWQLLSERRIKSSGGFISGRPDLLILKNGMPYEIKDYKTGQVFREDIPEIKAGDDDNYYDFIKDQYRNQLLLYAFLVQGKYGSLPLKLTIVTTDGTEISGPCIPEDVMALTGEIRKMHGDLISLSDAELARPSVENCRYCNYKPGCRFSMLGEPDPYGDLTGTADEIKFHAFGNFTITLTSGKKIFMPQPYPDAGSILRLQGLNLFINNVRRSVNNPDVYFLTKFSLVYSIQH